jgi:hypothetical protein
MTKDTAVRALSDDELDSVSGGADNGIVVCSQDAKFSFFGFLTFHFQACPYVSTDGPA